jgi:UPF0716 protein FxsA
VRYLVLAFVVLPLLELLLLLVIGSHVGFLPTVALTLAMGAVGGLVARREGLRVWREWQRALAELRPPEAGIIDGVLVLVGAALFITPGVVSDALGIVLMVPWTRRRVAARVRAAIDRHVASGQLRMVSLGAIPPGPGGTAPIDTTGETVDPG